MKIITGLLLIMTISLCSCNNRQKSNDVFLNKRVNLSLNKMRHLDSPRFIENIDSLRNMPYKFVVYYDSTICPSCVISHIGSWHRLVYFQKRPMVDYVFIFQKKKEKTNEFMDYYHGIRWHYNIYLDSLGVFEHENNELVAKNKINMFMVDKTGKILFIGNPTKSLDAQKSYETILDSISNIDEGE